jgi:hypothetical protein
MAKLTFEVTATAGEFSTFADRLGYMSVITTGFNEDGTPITAPNPETKQDFLLRVLKEQIAGVFYKPLVSDIEKQVYDTREAEKEATRTNIRNRVAVNFIA